MHSQHYALKRLMWGQALDVLVMRGRDYGHWFGWCDGGCAMAAEGLYSWLRASAAPAVIAIVEDRRMPGLPQHLVVHAGTYYLDADGIVLHAAMLAHQRREGLTAPHVVPVRPVLGRPDIGIIRRDAAVSRDLAHLLMAKLGPFRPT